MMFLITNLILKDFIMNAATKLTIAAACLMIADKLGSNQRNKQEAAQKQAFQNESQEIATLTENYVLAANLLLTNYRLRDAQEQEVRSALRNIDEVKYMSLNHNKRKCLEDAKRKLEYVYNAVK